MSAKFIAQIEISKPCVSSVSSPAEASRPRIVSNSGSPAATREPKASTRIAIVTGQEKSSDFIIAVRLAALKSDHIPDAPVRLTETLPVASACSLPFSVSAAATIAVGSRCAPATTSAVWPSREIETPGRGGTTVAIRESERRIASAFATVARNAGELVVSVGGMDDNDRRRTGEAAEVLLDQRARLHRLGAVRLPTRARQRRLDLRREHRQRERDHRPGERDDPHVVSRPAAEPADRPDGLPDARPGRGGTDGNFGNSHSRLLS